MTIKEGLAVKEFNEYKEKYGLEGFYIDDKARDMCCVYEQNGEAIAVFTYYKEDLKNIKLTWFEMFEKCQGKGQETVLEVLKYLQKIYNPEYVSIDTAGKEIEFWEKCGFTHRGSTSLYYMFN